MKVFYARVSSQNQNPERQVQQAKEIGAERIYIDKASGKNTDRKEKKKMMSFLRSGDELIVSDLTRLGRSSKDILFIIEDLNAREIKFRSLKENFETETPNGRFVLSIFSAMAELERENIRARQAEGIAIAKAQGKYKGRKKIDLNNEEFRNDCADWRAGKITAVSIMRKYNISSPCFYRKVKEYNL